MIAVPAVSGRADRIAITARRICHEALLLDADLYHLHDPELIPWAVMLRSRGKKVIYDAHENLPLQILSKPWIPGILRRPLSNFSSLGLRLSSRLIFSAIVAAEPEIENEFPASKTVLVQNFPMLDELQAKNAVPYTERPNRIANIGGISRIRCIREMLRAIEELDGEHARLILGGKFESRELFQEVSGYRGWEQVDYAGWMDRKQVRDALNSVRAGLVLLYPEPTYIEAQPIKLYEYMSASLPVVASNFPLHRKVVEGNNCGICVDPQKPHQIAEAVKWLLNNPEEAQQMGRNGRGAVEEKYNWNHEAGKLLGLYERLLS